MQFSKRNNLENSKMKNMKVTLEEEEAKVCYETFQNFSPKSDGCPRKNSLVFTHKSSLGQNLMWQQRERKRNRTKKLVIKLGSKDD